ncbi:MAG: hypothetical protein WDN72_04975 [Alphaproteobacteria bacterium]
MVSEACATGKPVYVYELYKDKKMQPAARRAARARPYPPLRGGRRGMEIDAAGRYAQSRCDHPPVSAAISATK